MVKTGKVRTSKMSTSSQSPDYEHILSTIVVPQMEMSKKQPAAIYKLGTVIRDVPKTDTDKKNAIQETLLKHFKTLELQCRLIIKQLRKELFDAHRKTRTLQQATQSLQKLMKGEVVTYYTRETPYYFPTHPYRDEFRSMMDVVKNALKVIHMIDNSNIIERELNIFDIQSRIRDAIKYMDIVLVYKENYKQNGSGYYSERAIMEQEAEPQEIYYEPWDFFNPYDSVYVYEDDEKGLKLDLMALLKTIIEGKNLLQKNKNYIEKYNLRPSAAVPKKGGASKNKKA